MRYSALMRRKTAISVDIDRASVVILAEHLVMAVSLGLMTRADCIQMAKAELDRFVYVGRSPWKTAGSCLLP
jgi:hypothetical protein